MVSWNRGIISYKYLQDIALTCSIIFVKALTHINIREYSDI